MTNRRRRAGMIMLIVAVAMHGAATAWAGTGYRSHGSAAKAARGFSNLVTGWMEIPYRMTKGSNRHDPVTSICEGALLGVGWGITRTAAGVAELATFWLPIPRDYHPLLPTPDYYWRWQPLEEWQQTYEETFK